MATGPAAPPLANASSAFDDWCGEGLEAFAMLIGVMLGLGGSVLINTGMNVQVFGLKELSPEDAKIRPFKSATWRIGLAIFIFGNMFNFIAFSFAPASVLVPLEAVQFLTNLVHARLLHKEQVPVRAYRGTALSSV